ncbi:MAG: dihydroxyacetone kinase subunit DhaK [Spirochaetota bacterium]
MAMKKFINHPDDLARELTRGMVRAYSNYMELIDEDIIVRKKTKEKGKVPIVFGQGIGHEPGLNGMIGYGMHDVEIGGNIFSCAGGERIYEGIKIAWERSGHTPVLVFIANHEGDVLNGNMAVEMAKEEGIDVESVLLYDDIASAPKGQEENRRGMAGMIFSFKTAGALAEQGRDRATIIKKAKQVNSATRTLLVALKSCTLPTTGQPLFSIADDEFFIGPGQHGEPGPEGPLKMMSANEIMDIIADRLIKDGEYQSGDDLLVIINGCGSTTLMEQFILYNRLEDILESKNMSPYKPLIGNFLTTQEMAGIQLTMCRADDEIKQLWDQPADTPYFKLTGV